MLDIANTCCDMDSYWQLGLCRLDKGDTCTGADIFAALEVNSALHAVATLHISCELTLSDMLIDFHSYRRRFVTVLDKPQQSPLR